ncbi:MAG: DUF3604 domain-containing protein, partial [bacterium]
VYTAGHPVDDNGYVLVVFRQMGDFGEPQFDEPGAPNYCSVSTTGDCVIRPRWGVKSFTRPWTKALHLQVTRGYLDRGEEVAVTFGDRSGGSPGWRMQTFCEHTFEFKTLVDPIATFEFKELPASPTLRVIAGEPVRAVCIAPSQVAAGERFDYHLKLEDRWGNPVGAPTRLTARLDAPGVHTVDATDPETGLSATSNPISVGGEAPDQPSADAGAVSGRRRRLNRYWADFHGQSEETVGSNSIDDYFSFARDVGLVDIVGHQGNDFQVTDEFWRTIDATSKACYEPGRFVTFPGYEWSGNTPLGGDRNVYFTGGGGRIVHSCTDLLPGKETRYAVAMTADDLFAELRKQTRPRAFVFAHVGGRYADLSMHDEEIELAVEVHSAWGTFEWLVDDALRRGYRIGIVANSDGHKCRPGASYPGATSFGSLGGLTCVLAGQLDRRNVAAALRARHCYATTGNRPLVDLALTTPGGRTATMGDVVEPAAGSATLRVRVAGTAPIQDVEVRNGLDVVKTVRPYGRDDLGRRLKIAWSGAEVRGRARMCAWDGELRARGNVIEKIEPINFWNPDRQPERIGKTRVRWRSITTGGTAGLILTLARPNAGAVELSTAQQTLTRAVRSVGLRPKTWKCGGLRKEVRMLRLPDRGRTRDFAFELPLRDLRPGDNPIYVRVTQEDGHMAWTSPVYVLR